MIEAIILCGGKGERLRPVLENLPKALAPVRGRPFLEWLVTAVALAGVRRIVLATGYRGEAIEQALGVGQRWQIQLTYSREPEPLGTAGAIRLAAGHLESSPLLVLNGDSYCRFQLQPMLDFHRRRRAAVTIWLQPQEESGRYGRVDLAGDGEVVSFGEKADTPALVNCGVYLIERAVIDQIPPKQSVSLERDVFPRLAGSGLYGFVGAGTFLDIGIPEALAKADNLLQEEFRLLEVQRKQIEDAQAYLDESLAVQRRSFAACLDQLVNAANAVAQSLKAGGKILLCGNGGSAADCQHVATELVGRLSRRLTRPAMAAIALTTDTSFLTAYANDVGFEGVFARQVEGLGRPGDVLIGISTSGRSRNVARAMEMARSRGMITIALVGDGGSLSDAVDHAIVVPDRDTQHIQETMLPLEHLMCLLIEDAIHGASAPDNRQP